MGIKRTLSKIDKFQDQLMKDISEASKEKDKLLKKQAKAANGTALIEKALLDLIESFKESYDRFIKKISGQIDVIDNDIARAEKVKEKINSLFE